MNFTTKKTNPFTNESIPFRNELTIMYPSEFDYYFQHLVACEHLFSIRDEHDSHVVHHNRIGCCPQLWEKGAVSSKEASGRVALHQAMSRSVRSV